MLKHHHQLSSLQRENSWLEDLLKENKELVSELWIECTYLFQDFSMAKFGEVRGGLDIEHFDGPCC